MKNLEKIQSKVNEIQAAADKAAEELQAKINKATEERGAATAALLRAQDAADPEEYARAAAEARTRGDILELYSKQKAKLDTQPLISTEDYDAMVNQIMAELDQVNAKAKAEAAKHLEALKAIGRDSTEVINYGNDLLHQVQHDLFKDPAEMITANGNRVHLEALEKRYKDYSFQRAVERVAEVTSYIYTEDK